MIRGNTSPQVALQLVLLGVLIATTAHMAGQRGAEGPEAHLAHNQTAGEQLRRGKSMVAVLGHIGDFLAASLAESVGQHLRDLPSSTTISPTIIEGASQHIRSDYDDLCADLYCHRDSEVTWLLPVVDDDDIEITVSRQGLTVAAIIGDDALEHIRRRLRERLEDHLESHLDGPLTGPIIDSSEQIVERGFMSVVDEWDCIYCRSLGDLYWYHPDYGCTSPSFLDLGG